MWELDGYCWSPLKLLLLWLSPVNFYCQSNGWPASGLDIETLHCQLVGSYPCCCSPLLVE